MHEVIVHSFRAMLLLLSGNVSLRLEVDQLPIEVVLNDSLMNIIASAWSIRSRD